MINFIFQGHFTQAVWKDSQQVGFGLAVNPDGQNFVVATYQPAGNMVGSYLQNVLPAKSTLGKQLCFPVYFKFCYENTNLPKYFVFVHL